MAILNDPLYARGVYRLQQRTPGESRTASGSDRRRFWIPFMPTAIRNSSAVVAYRPILEAAEMRFRSIQSFPAAVPLFLILCLLAVVIAGPAQGQGNRTFRLDGGNATYAFGVNQRGELQALYWGGRLGSHDAIPAAYSLPEMASFDSPYTTTPQEFASWGAGLFTEPALKAAFADGNRDVVLHFVRATTVNAQNMDVALT